MRRISALVLAGLFSAGCATVVVEAPEGRRVPLATQDAPTEATYQKRVWYFLWGLVPLTNNSSADLVAKVPQGKKVRVKVQYSLTDVVIGIFTSLVSVVPQTVEVEVTR